MAKRRKRPGQRGRFYKRMTPEEEVEQREAAFIAIKRLYRESLPLWRVCPRGFCRRHRACGGFDADCLPRGWKLMPPAAQNEACRLVMLGGPHRRPPATNVEKELRHFPPSNFVHRP